MQHQSVMKIFICWRKNSDEVKTKKEEKKLEKAIEWMKMKTVSHEYQYLIHENKHHFFVFYKRIFRRKKMLIIVEVQKAVSNS